MSDDTIELASALLGEPLAAVGRPLPTSDRNRVVRAAREDGSTVIVKRYLTSDNDGRWRELAALRTLQGSAADVPEVVACDDQMAVMQDLGDHPHLASVLLDDNPSATQDGLKEWARALGRVHAAGLSRVAAFEAEFLSHTGRSSDYMQELLDDAAASWPQLARRLEVEIDTPFELLAQAPRRLRTRLDTISPGDTCPDNNLSRDGVFTLIDLEFASARHAIWDVAFLVVPWPSCWCAWTMPHRAVVDAVSAWGDAVGLHPGPDLEHDLALAVDTWHWLSANWLLDRLLGGQDGQRPDRPSPRAQDRIARSLDAVASSSVFPELAAAADKLLAGLVARYDVEALPSMPAFR